MRFTIKSRNEGDFNFWCPDNGGYIYLELEGKPGTLGKQICHGGGFFGSTMSCSNRPSDFEATCRYWYRKYRQNIS
jgi:hypothetical protein